MTTTRHYERFLRTQPTLRGLKRLLDARGVRQNFDEALEALERERLRRHRRRTK